MAYRQAASRALGDLRSNFDFSIFLSTFRVGFLARVLGDTCFAFFRVYRQALRDHGSFISTSAINFLERPFTQE